MTGPAVELPDVDLDAFHFNGRDLAVVAALAVTAGLFAYGAMRIADALGDYCQESERERAHEARWLTLADQAPEGWQSPKVVDVEPVATDGEPCEGCGE